MQATGNPLAVRCSAQPKCQEATKLVRRRKFGSVATALLGTLGVVCVACGAGPGASSVAHHAPPPPPAVRLYVFDGGTLHIADLGRFRLSKEEIATSDLSVTCFLIAHPKGTLIWDTGAVPDAVWTPDGTAVTKHIVLPDAQERDIVISKSLRGQLATIGYEPSDITYLALSHYHYDHTANANLFASATWLVRQAERDAMFRSPRPGVTQPSTYESLKTSKTLILDNDEYDVFGDGKVIIKAALGHTPGHQVLYVNLANTGPILLSGDLWHYPEERSLDRVPTFEFDQAQTRATRRVIEAFLKKTGAQLWVQHDFVANAKLRKAPEYYD